MPDDRLKFRRGDMVQLTNDVVHRHVYTIMRVEPALEAPYFLNDNEFHNENELEIYVPPDRTWDDIEGDIKRLIGEIRRVFADHDEPRMRVEVRADGMAHGEVEIEYVIAHGEYDSNRVRAFSLRPALDEYFRRKTWTKRNAPVALTYDGDE